MATSSSKQHPHSAAGVATFFFPLEGQRQIQRDILEHNVLYRVRDLVIQKVMWVRSRC